MHLGRVGTLIGFSIGSIASGIQLIDGPREIFGWGLIVLGLLTAIISLAWWVFEKPTDTRLRRMFWPTILVAASTVGLITGVVWAISAWPYDATDQQSSAPAPPRSPSSIMTTFREGRAIDGPEWSSLLRVANEARLATDGTPLARAAARDSAAINDVLAFYAGRLNELVQLHGVPLSSLPSEPIKQRGGEIRFRVNGDQMDASDARGTEIYRFIHMRTPDVPVALSKLKEVSQTSADPPTTSSSK